MMISFENRPWPTAGRIWRSMFQGAGRSSKRWRICLQGDIISIFRWNNFPLFPLSIPKGGESIPYIVGFLVGSWPRFVTTVWSRGFSPVPLPSLADGGAGARSANGRARGKLPPCSGLRRKGRLLATPHSSNSTSHLFSRTT